MIDELYGQMDELNGTDELCGQKCSCYFARLRSFTFDDLQCFMYYKISCSMLTLCHLYSACREVWT